MVLLQYYSVSLFLHEDLRHSPPIPRSSSLVSCPLFEFVSRLGLRTRIPLLVSLTATYPFHTHTRILNQSAFCHLAHRRPYCCTRRPCYFSHRAANTTQICVKSKNTPVDPRERPLTYLLFCSVFLLQPNRMTESVLAVCANQSRFTYHLPILFPLGSMRSPEDLAAVFPHGSSGLLQEHA